MHEQLMQQKMNQIPAGGRQVRGAATNALLQMQNKTTHDFHDAINASRNEAQKQKLL